MWREVLDFSDIFQAGAHIYQALHRSELIKSDLDQKYKVARELDTKLKAQTVNKETWCLIFYSDC